MSEPKVLRLNLDYLASTYGIAPLITAQVVTKDGVLLLILEGASNATRA